MGCICSCCCSKVLDERFDVGVGPEEAKQFLLDRPQWLQIIPGCAKGRISEDNENDTWTVHGNLDYIFTNTVASNEGALSYTVMVQGRSCVSPVHFTFNVDYTFTARRDYGEGEGGATIRRRVFDLKLLRCGFLLHRTIQKNTRKACQQENKNMARLMEEG